MIHDGGAKACIQINPHRGRSDEVDPASASETIHPQTGVKVRALTIADLKDLEEAFGEGAKRAKEAGFDCVMIHGASGYLVSEFLSSRTNRRTDEYGGDIRKRARFALNLLTVVKEKLGADYPVIFRLTAHERMEGGFGLEDAITVSKLLEKAGADAIDVISGVAETYHWVAPNMYIPRGFNAPLSQAIKKEVSIPISVAETLMTLMWPKRF
jgi:2,4-dienoyl-CoA reductase-like NADH-dependent reductase (Old Yellow Enzyme family)